MRTIISAVAGIMLLSCNSSTRQSSVVQMPRHVAKDSAKYSVQQSTDSLVVGNETSPSGFKELDAFMQQFKRPTQHFSVKADSSAWITGAKGTRILIKPSDLEATDGSNISGKLDVELIELQKAEDFLRNGMPTTSGDKLLESGGAYYINARSGGKSLRLKAGRMLTVQFPRKTEKQMQLYRGVQNAGGDVDWLRGEQKFTQNTEEDSVVVRTEIPTYKDTILQKLEMRPDRRERTNIVEKYRKYAPVEIKIIDGEPVITGRTLYTDHKWYSEKKMTGRDMLAQQFYQSMRLSGFGWFNCDRIVPEPTIVMQAGATGVLTGCVEAFIVYKNLNSVDRKRFITDKNHAVQLSNLTDNQPVKVVALSWQKGQAYAFVKNLKTDAGTRIQLDLKPVTTAELDKMLTM